MEGYGYVQTRPRPGSRTKSKGETDQGETDQDVKQLTELRPEPSCEVGATV